jgi:histidyl-tRNA synthetase
MVPASRQKPRYFVTVFAEQAWGESLDVVCRLRQAGIDTDISFQAGDIGRQLKDASARGFSHGIIIGPDERQSGTVTVRDLESRTDERLKLIDLVSRRTDRRLADK